jgi:hypothetical protein
MSTTASTSKVGLFSLGERDIGWGMPFGEEKTALVSPIHAQVLTPCLDDDLRPGGHDFLTSPIVHPTSPTLSRTVGIWNSILYRSSASALAAHELVLG